jgi:DNA polymerase-3 subunit alpha
MAAIDFEDLHGHVEITVFSRLYNSVKDILEEENVILLTGRVEVSDDIHKIVATNIELMPKKYTRKLTEPGKIYIQIDEPGLITDEMLENISEIMVNYPGQNETIITLQLPSHGYKLYGTAAISEEGVRQLRKQPHINVKSQPYERKSE